MLEIICDYCGNTIEEKEKVVIMSAEEFPNTKEAANGYSGKSKELPDRHYHQECYKDLLLNEL